MKKFNLMFVTLFLLFGIVATAQETKISQEKEATKIESFSSKTGVISKYSDFNLSPIPCLYSENTVRIRKITQGKLTGYFYQIEKQGKYSNIVASIEYSDLLEIKKALVPLKQECQIDISSTSDYLDNKFTTEDGLQIGYIVSSKKQITWYIKLDKYSSENILFIKSVEDLEAAIVKAVSKIEELKTNK